ncbi:hypothetical protein ACIBG4_32690 [Nonomuraea sp. NPDC050383]|uniref:hypothetical protein n=1 Tax=Nonomuraea sp. NPDC050383 TaxID=3364362 RepID=UPI003787499C
MWTARRRSPATVTGKVHQRKLIARVEVVDDTASALRIIDLFDQLVEPDAVRPAVVRAAAAMAGCPAGLHDAGRG